MCIVHVLEAWEVNYMLFCQRGYKTKYNNCGKINLDLTLVQQRKFHTYIIVSGVNLLVSQGVLFSLDMLSLPQSRDPSFASNRQ